ncbi:MAG: CoA transferase [Saprospiraceae bacterium]|nr:CoA transferase [Saprospiraceae bacterium]
MLDFASVFKDLKVVELATALAGPLTGTYFKELGAQVLKIEPPRGDVSRMWKNPFEKDPATSIYYDSINGLKPCITLDLKNEKDRQKLELHISESDIIISNFTRKKALEFSVSYPDLQKIKSDIILANVTGYGPEVEKAAFDMMIQADSGLLSMTGYPHGLPAKVPLAIADILASHQLREGILCCLLKRLKTGEGSEIQVTLMDSLVSSFTNQAGNYLMGNFIPQPLGTLHPSIAPYGDIFLTADHKYLLLAVGSDVQFQRFCSAIQYQEWVEDGKFRTNQSRIENREQLGEEIGNILCTKSANEWIETFAEWQVPAARIRNLQEVLDDPALQHLIVKETGDSRLIKRMKTLVY